MSNWDLMMPGMGLTAIGLSGVFISYAEIAHTFIDGMHALTGLTMFIGLIFLASGILEGGVSTSNKAKATTLVIVAIALSFGMVGVVSSTVSTIPVFAGLMMIVTIPSILIAYVAMKFPTYAKPVSTIFIIGAVAAIVTYVGFGFAGPDPYLVHEEVIEEIKEVIEEVSPTAPAFTISVLAGSSEPDNPDYDPDVATVPHGTIVEWVNDDTVAHTSTSSLDFGETFDSGLFDAGASYRLDTSGLAVGEYEYLCIVHPWMIATLIIEEAQEPIIAEVSMPEGASIEQIGQIYYDPESITVSVGTTVVWSNDDSTIHTVTSGSPESGPTELFDSSILDAGATFEYTFNSAETVDYYCIVHPWMIGSVTAE